MMKLSQLTHTVSEKFKDTLDMMMWFALLSALLMAIGVVAKAVAPVATVLFAIVLTVSAFERWSTTVLSIAGIACYAAAWGVHGHIGPWPLATLMGCFGFLVWFMAAMNSLEPKTVTVSK